MLTNTIKDESFAFATEMQTKYPSGYGWLFSCNHSAVASLMGFSM